MTLSRFIAVVFAAALVVGCKDKDKPQAPKPAPPATTQTKIPPASATAPATQGTLTLPTTNPVIITPPVTTPPATKPVSETSKPPVVTTPKPQVTTPKPPEIVTPRPLIPSPSQFRIPRIGVDLPAEFNTPDGMALDKAGNIVLSVPNFGDPKFPACMLRISADNKIEKLIDLTPHPDTKRACPLGVDVGPDGNLYIADCQGFLGDAGAYKSRLLRVVMKDNKAVKCETLAEGFVFINAIVCRGDFVYATETKFDANSPKGKPIESGVYRFKVSELSADKPLKIARDSKDDHVICRLTTKNPDWAIGANGLAFGNDGTMYVGNFGDAQVIAYTLDAAGKITGEKILTQGGPIKSTDGMKVDQVTGLLYIADFLANAVHRVNPTTGRVETLAQNPVGTGLDGALDKPSEVCIRNGKLYISNIDLEMDGNKFDKPHTVSVIDLDTTSTGTPQPDFRDLNK